MNPSSPFANNEISTGVRNNKKNVLNKLMTDSGEQGEDSNNVNKKNDNNRKDLPYLIDSREQNNQIHLQPQNLNQYNTNSFNTNNINKEEYIREINKVLSHSPNLKIELMNSVSLPKGLTFDITPLGMMDSKREPKDGYTYFGFMESNQSTALDFLIKPKEQNYEPRYVGKHFQIRFNPTDLKYYIQDLGCGFGTFMKLTNEIVIKDNYLINIGNSYIVCIYGNDDLVQMDNVSSDISDKLLNIKIFSGNGNNEQSSFNPNTKSKICIGRDPECDIVIDDSLLSRVHCTIIYKENIGWVLRDGRYIDEDESKSSTNGTWLYLMEETEIYEGMIFKGNQNLFVCSYSTNNENRQGIVY